MVLALVNIIITGSVIGLGAFVAGRSKRYPPAFWLLLYAISLACFSASLTLNRLATTGMGLQIVTWLTTVGVAGTNAMLVMLLARLFVPEWWEGRRPIRWISLPFFLVSAVTLLDVSAGSGIFATWAVSADGIVTMQQVQPWTNLLLLVYMLSWLVHGGILIGAFLRRPALRGLVIAMGLAIALAVIGATTIGVVLMQIELAALALLPFLGVLAFAVFRTRLLIPTEVAIDLAISAMSEAVIVLNDSNRVTYANPTAQTLGVQPGQTIEQLLAATGAGEATVVALMRQIGQQEPWEERNLLFGERVFAVSSRLVRSVQNRVIGTLLLARDITEINRRTSELEHERERLAVTVARLQAEQARRETLAGVVRTLALPVIPIQAGVLIMPLVGEFDTTRSDEFTRTLLQAIERERARAVLIDITGVPVVDTSGATVLMRAVRAAGLLGCRCTLVGIRPEIAQALVSLGVSFDNLATSATLEQGLRTALDGMGAKS